MERPCICLEIAGRGHDRVDSLEAVSNQIPLLPVKKKVHVHNIGVLWYSNIVKKFFDKIIM